MSRTLIVGILSIAFGLSAIAFSTPATAAHPNALWRVVHGLCVRDKRLIGRASPCLEVDLAKGWAVVPDPEHRSQVLLVPTSRISGIESPALLKDGAPNYWQAAWVARRFVERRLHRPIARDRIGLAINSVATRSQRQLHIHVDCVRPDVRAFLMAHESEIGPVWRHLDVRIAGHAYQARRLEGADLGARDPFLLLAHGDPAARADMGRQSLAVIGMTFSDGSPGFVLLADGGPAAFAEALLDHGCRVLSEP